NTHHVVSDGWSDEVFHRELSVLYGAFTARRPSPLPELPVQYADFAVWQRNWLSGEVLERQLAYWRVELADMPLLELPTDRPRPVVQSFRGAVETFRLPCEPLNALSREQGTTLFMTLLAVFQALLERTTGQVDLAVGSVVANRNRAEIETLLGFFVNTLVLRGDLRGNPRFHEHLARVRDVALGAYAHQDVPFEKLVEELAPQRDLSQNPLVQVLLVLQNAPTALRDLVPGLDGSLEGVAIGEAKLDLTLLVWEQDGALRGTAEYGTDLFEATTIRRLLGHFTALLAGVTDDPECRISDLPLLNPSERHQLVAEWNDTAAFYPAQASIPELFEAQARKTPDAVAVVFNAGGAAAEQVSYRELNRRANRLAHHLRGWGVGSEVCVGLCLERSVEMVVAILGILKAGGAYVPLDPSYPSERLALMLEDLRAPVLVCRDRLPERLAAVSARTRLVRIPGDGPAISRCSPENPELTASPENLAYVMFTSGSTGRP
ncbi:MAG: AMP-binding protein, partial [bacterium]|nr:AMP-binding protein [bacterium]